MNRKLPATKKSPAGNNPILHPGHEKDWADLIAYLGCHQVFVVCTHVNPDPDALASLLALTKCLRRLGKKVYPVVPESIPQRFQFLPGSSLLKILTVGKKISYDAMIVLDCGDLERIGQVQTMISAGRPIINIDHHVTNHLFGQLNLVVPEASSTAEVIFDLLARLNFTLDEDIANLLYIGIMTDTGSFRYDNTTPHTHFVVSELLKFPVPVAMLYRRLYESIPAHDVKNFTALVNSAEFLLNGRVVCLELTRRQIKKFSEEFDLRDKIFRYVRAIKGVEVIVIFTEEAKDRTRVNFRSQGRVDVARLAFHFHGGGHSRASGCQIPADLKVARKNVLAEIRRILRLQDD